MHGDLEALVDDPCSSLWFVGTVAGLLIASPAVVGESTSIWPRVAPPSWSVVSL